VRRLESMAKGEGLLDQDQPISRSSSFRRIMRELNIESRRIGFGPRASYRWRLEPPAWTGDWIRMSVIEFGCAC
jgi:hypothetical protein